MKRFQIHAPMLKTTFEVAVYTNMTDESLHRAVATRAKLPLTYSDGSESFYMTDGADPEGPVVLPLSVALPHGVVLTMHVNDPPAPSGASAAPAAKPSTPDDAAQMLQAAVRGRQARQAAKRCGCCPDFRQLCSFQIAQLMPGFVHEKYDTVGSEPLGSDAEDQLHGVAKMSRLATDLANERTLLAWIRTVLAVMRTVFSTLGMAGVGATWVVVQRSAVGLMVFLMLASTFIGIYRYHKVARIVNLKTVPTYFGRASIVPLNVGVAISVTTVAVAAMLQGFE